MITIVNEEKVRPEILRAMIKRRDRVIRMMYGEIFLYYLLMLAMLMIIIFRW